VIEEYYIFYLQKSADSGGLFFIAHIAIVVMNIFLTHLFYKENEDGNFFSKQKKTNAPKLMLCNG